MSMHTPQSRHLVSGSVGHAALLDFDAVDADALFRRQSVVRVGF